MLWCDPFVLASMLRWKTGIPIYKMYNIQRTLQQKLYFLFHRIIPKTLNCAFKMYEYKNLPWILKNTKIIINVSFKTLWHRNRELNVHMHIHSIFIWRFPNQKCVEQWAFHSLSYISYLWRVSNKYMYINIRNCWHWGFEYRATLSCRVSPNLSRHTNPLHQESVTQDR